MSYQQLSEDERYRLAELRHRRVAIREIGRIMGRSASTISREVKRNAYPTDGWYRARHAQSMAVARRKRSRRVTQFSLAEWKRVEELLRKDWSPEQVSGRLKRETEISMSHETIYRHVWWDKRWGGDLWTHLRGSRKKRRKRYGAYDSRGRLGGKRMIDKRPSAATKRSRTGHWEGDTMMGRSSECVLTLVDRKSGLTRIGLLKDRTKEETNLRLVSLLVRGESYKTITSDNGCEFHGYREVEKRTGVKFYFAHPHHSWERGTNENTNGLIRQYLPKGTSMERLTQARCNAIAEKLNNRPRKRHNYQTPNEVHFKVT